MAGADPQRPVTISEPARRVLLEGLRGAASYGSAQALNVRKPPVLAKTGTAPMPGGSWMGLVVALEPADKPTRGIVVVAPGAAGLDAAAIAADLLEGNLQSGGSVDPPKAGLRAIRIGLAGAGGSNAGGSSGGGTKDPPLRTISLDLEEYIARVVAAEGEQGAPDAAQQALAITARTFALANLQRHRREGYDLCDTTHCQVLRAPTAASRRAAEATAGRVLLHQSQPASVFYSASCGGYSELASAVWPGAVNHAAPSQRDDACRSEPPWESAASRRRSRARTSCGRASRRSITGYASDRSEHVESRRAAASRRLYS